MEGFDDPDPDSDYDYEESYTKRKGKKRTSKVARNTDSPATKKPKVLFLRLDLQYLFILLY